MIGWRFSIKNGFFLVSRPSAHTIVVFPYRFGLALNSVLVGTLEKGFPFPLRHSLPPGFAMDEPQLSNFLGAAFVVI